MLFAEGDISTGTVIGLTSMMMTGVFAVLQNRNSNRAKELENHSNEIANQAEKDKLQFNVELSLVKEHQQQCAEDHKECKEKTIKLENKIELHEQGASRREDVLIEMNKKMAQLEVLLSINAAKLRLIPGAIEPTVQPRVQQ